MSEYATVQREGFTVPLIGIPAAAVKETCDECGVEFGLCDLTMTGSQMLCKKCQEDE